MAEYSQSYTKWAPAFIILSPLQMETVSKILINLRPWSTDGAILILVLNASVLYTSTTVLWPKVKIRGSATFENVIVIHDEVNCSEENYSIDVYLFLHSCLSVMYWYFSFRPLSFGPEAPSRDSGGFLDLAASTVKGILGPLADRMKGLSPDKPIPK